MCKAVLTPQRTVNFSIDCLNVLAQLGAHPIEVVLLSANFHQLARGRVKVRLELLQVASLAEQRFRGGSTLILQDLLAFQIGSFGSLHELVPIVLVPCLQMVQSVQERINFLLTLLDFAVELISEPLQFFLLLGRFNHIVGLRVFPGGLHFTTTRLVFLDETFVFDAQILDLVLALLKLDLNSVTLFLGRLDFRVENVHVNLDFLFTFLFRHLQLVLLVLERVNLICFCDHLLAQLLNFKFHDVVLNQSLLFALYDSFQVATSHLILKFQLADDIRKDFLLIFDLLNDLVDVATLVFELLVGVGQLAQLLLVLLQLVVQLPNLLLQLLLFFLGHLAFQLVHPSLHLLDLELLRVKQLLLSLLFNFQLCDVGLQVSRG